MRQKQTFSRIHVAILLCLPLAGCKAASPHGFVMPVDTQLSPVGWLAGSWAADNGATITEEHWTQPFAGTMLGMNRTVAGGKTVFFEYLRIEKTPDGIIYWASPKGRAPATPFKLIERGDQRAVFENPDHDFPQRIVYERNGDQLRGRIEGLQRGQPATEEWVWRKIK